MKSAFRPGWSGGFGFQCVFGGFGSGSTQLVVGGFGPGMGGGGFALGVGTILSGL